MNDFSDGSEGENDDEEPASGMAVAVPVAPPAWPAAVPASGPTSGESARMAASGEPSAQDSGLLERLLFGPARSAGGRASTRRSMAVRSKSTPADPAPYRRRSM